jgi:hypothetical protein
VRFEALTAVTIWIAVSVQSSGLLAMFLRYLMSAFKEGKQRISTLRGFSPRANSTDRATAACRRS